MLQETIDIELDKNNTVINLVIEIGKLVFYFSIAIVFMDHILDRFEYFVTRFTRYVIGLSD